MTDNITCPKCRFRHPATRTCADAKEMASLNARIRQLEEQNASLRGDLNIAQLQLGARICSQCPDAARIDFLEANWHALGFTRGDTWFTLGSPIVRYDSLRDSVDAVRALRRVRA